MLSFIICNIRLAALVTKVLSVRLTLEHLSTYDALPGCYARWKLYLVFVVGVVTLCVTLQYIMHRSS